MLTLTGGNFAPENLSYGGVLMFKFKQYKPGFDPRGLALFLIIMLPNFIWFALPAPNDILRSESRTAALDAAASAFQVFTVVSLCFIINQSGKKPKKGFAAGIAAAVTLYFVGWACYYAGIANAAVVLDLTLAPCAAFILFSASRKNAPALISAAVFSICHLISAAINFILL